MPQFLVPITPDVAVGSWTETPLWSKVDETVASVGSDVITSHNNTSPDNADFLLSTGGDPVSSSGHIIRARWNKSAADGHSINAVAELWQGVPGTGTLVATLTVTGITETEQTSTHTLTAGEADAITDYAALHLRVSRQGATGGAMGTRRSLVVNAVELEIPDAAAVPVLGDGAVTLGAITTSGAGTVPVQGAGAVTLGGITVAGVGVVVSKAETLTDDFEDGTRGSQWTESPGFYTLGPDAGTITETGGRLRIEVGANQNATRGWRSTDAYDIRSSHFHARVYPPTWDSTAMFVAFDVGSDLSTASVAQLSITIETYPDDTTPVYLRLRYRNGSTTWNEEQITYDPVAHAWLRFAHDGTNVLWQTAPDGATWTTRRTVAASTLTSHDFGAVYVALVAGKWASQDTSFVAEYDNVNLTPITGDGAITLGGLEAAGAGTVGTATRTGDGAVTLGGLEASGAGTVPRTGDGALTLGAITASGAGTVAVQGAGAVTLGAVEVASAGTVASTPLSGDGALTLGALAVAGAGVVPVAGAGAVTLGAIEAAGTGAVLVQGAGAVTLGALEVSGSAGALVVGNGAVTLGALEVSGAGSVLVAGAGAVTLGALEVAGTGAVVVSGAGAITLGALETAGAGAVPRTGDGAITLGAIVVAGTSEFVVTGNGAIILGGLDVAGAGSVPRTGAGAVTFGPLTVVGAGSIPVVGDGAVALGALEVTGAGEFAVVGSGTLTLGGLVVVGAGAIPVAGAGAVSLGALIVLGAGNLSATGEGDGAVTLGALTVSGTGSVPRTGDGAITLGAIIVVGAGPIFTGTGSWAFVLDGHVFYVLSDVDGKTFVCDLTTGQWHHWYTGDDARQWNMYRGIMWNGRIIACDGARNEVWEVDPASMLDEETLQIQRAVTAFAPLRGKASMRQGSLRVTASMGDPTADPATVNLRFTDNEGESWSVTHTRTLDVDAFGQVLRFRSLGRVRAPGRIWEVTDRGGLVRIEGVDSDMEGM